MYIIKKSCWVAFTMQKVNFLWSGSNYIQFSRAKCKKIARTIYFYITENKLPVCCYFKEHF